MRSWLIDGSVEINSNFLWKISLWAINSLASKLWISVTVIESSEPVSTYISSKSPFSEPNFVFDLISGGSVTFVVSTELFSGIHTLVPSLIVMMIHSNFIDIIISEEIIPHSWVIMERVMEDEVSLWCMLLDKWSNASIEVLENINIRTPPWLVNWLERTKGLVGTPSLE